MRKKKIITTLLISTLALSSILTACGTKKNTSENATELVTEATTDTLTSADGSSVEGIELEGLTFNSSEVEVTADMSTAITNAGLDSGYTTVKSFDLNMTDVNNEKVQPNGTVSITKTLDKLNAPEGYTTEYRVYYYNPDTNTFEACNTTYEDSTVTFAITHFSVYMYFCVYLNKNKRRQPKKLQQKQKRKHRLQTQIVLLMELLTQMLVIILHLMKLQMIHLIQ